MTQTRYTRHDYMRLPEGYSVELLDGCFVKEPFPSQWHQRLVLGMGADLLAIVGPDRVMVAPSDVFLDEYNIFQPDVLVLPEDERIRPGHTSDATPVLVIEVLSPSSEGCDRVRKSETYLRAGALEVWLVDPDTETIELRTPDGSEAFSGSESAESSAVPGFHLIPDVLFKVD